jgi:hypothetical protein
MAASGAALAKEIKASVVKVLQCMIECDKILNGYIIAIEVFIYGHVPYGRAVLTENEVSDISWKSSPTAMMKRVGSSSSMV